MAKPSPKDLPLPQCHVCGGRQLWGSRSLTIDNVLVFGAPGPMVMEVRLDYGAGGLPFLCQDCLVKCVTTGMAQLNEGVPQ